MTNLIDKSFDFHGIITEAIVGGGEEGIGTKFVLFPNAKRVVLASTAKQKKQPKPRRLILKERLQEVVVSRKKVKQIVNEKEEKRAAWKIPKKTRGCHLIFTPGRFGNIRDEIREEYSPAAERSAARDIKAHCWPERRRLRVIYQISSGKNSTRRRTMLLPGTRVPRLGS
ncbi:hypothetical protein DMENIID0001_029420 [Sergentomyia squamirostris]